MRATVVVLLLMAAAALSGCVDTSNGGDGPDPFTDTCEFPDDTGTTAFVGGVATPAGQPIEGVEARATPQNAALEEVVDVSNQAGCYYLSLDADVVYDVTWAKDGYSVEQLDAVTVADGEKQIQHVYLRPL